MTPLQSNRYPFYDKNGNLLQSGSIYIGQPNADPRSSSKTVTFQDSSGYQFTAAQPLTTINGIIVYNGKPIMALVNGEYSMLVLDSSGSQVDYQASVNAAASASIADYSDLIRVGLTLSDVKAFDVSVGNEVRSVGKTTATDGGGQDWLVISSTGTPGDDITLIDFANGLQGQAANKPGYQIFTSSGTFTATKTGDHLITLIGGGGGGSAGGGNTATTKAAGGGGIGGCSGEIVRQVVSLTSGTDYAVTIGAGGAGGTGVLGGNGNIGSSGSDSTFAALVTASGGHFGYNSFADICTTSGHGFSGSPGGGQGGGYGGPGTNNQPTGGNGGDGIANSGGGGGGGGGSGTLSSTSYTGGNGGNGGSGICIVEWL